VIYIYPKVMVAKSRGDDNMTWFRALKIALWGGGTARGQPANTHRSVPVTGEGTSLNKDETTTG
jgi:hypothetical protein